MVGTVRRVAKSGAYRVQLRPSFTFDDAAELAPYLKDLGLSHLYASPYLQAADGSTHGYDVVDPGRVNAELGGDAGRKRLGDALAAHGLAQLLDVVPNHMAIRGGHNEWWWDVLENGPSSQYSGYFDVEWQSAAADRVLLPILGDQYGVEVEAGNIRLERREGRFLVCYYEHENPVAPRVLGRLLAPVAKALSSEELGFVADALAELPAPNVTDTTSRRRRHRDKEVLFEQLRLHCERPGVARAIDDELERINAAPDELDAVLEDQSYRLAHWKVGNHELDYRRFFDVDSLVGLRVEDEEVLGATHHLVFDWLADGSIAGVRVDHIDGLYDPKGYLARVSAHSPEAWLLVEKILEGREDLPDWPVAGTTGYELLNQVQRVLVDPAGQSELDRGYAEIVGGRESYDQMLAVAKREVLRVSLASDVQRLVVRLATLCYQHRRYRDYPRVELEAALVELCVAYPVYRTYLRVGAGGAVEASPTDRAVIERAVEAAASVAQHIDARLFGFIQQLLLLEIGGDEAREFALRFQQLTGPTMAKGAEDTVFYRYVRLVALNEVGGAPGHFSIGMREFHEWMAARQDRHPEALSTTSTHDTKRSEDVRARLLALSEAPREWSSFVEGLRARLATAKTPGAAAGEPAPEPRTEYMLLQNLVGAWPIEKPRMVQYMTKAVREAKSLTSWHENDEAYERAIERYLDTLYADPEVLAGVDAYVASLRDAAIANALDQVVLKVLCPGVPDVYQGTELWDFSLVDPDNRRPVDFVLRRGVLSGLSDATPSELWERRADGAVKMFVLREALRLRARRPRCFDARGDYAPLYAQGPMAERVVAWGRGDAVVAVATRWWKKHGADFGDTTLSLPAGAWRNLLTGAVGLAGNRDVADLLGPLPTAILERQDANHG